MINPSTIDIASLPWLPLDERSAFPRQPAIYFAIDSQDQIQYIGISKDAKRRWEYHQQYDRLRSMGSVRVAYMFVQDVSLLRSIEKALIEWFDPPLNVVGRKPESRPARLAADRVSTVDVRNKLRLVRRRVQSGEVIPVYQYVDLVGYLVPVDLIDDAAQGAKFEEFRLIDFRNNLTTIADKLAIGDSDIVYVTYHDRRAMAFVSADFWERFSRM